MIQRLGRQEETHKTFGKRQDTETNWDYVIFSARPSPHSLRRYARDVAKQCALLSDRRDGWLARVIESYDTSAWRREVQQRGSVVEKQLPTKQEYCQR